MDTKLQENEHAGSVPSKPIIMEMPLPSILYYDCLIPDFFIFFTGWTGTEGSI